ncbi:MAG: ketoacyl-ACP synthase III [Alphaproteobacteria bacterium]|nr:ketoacyl-ACP synthase III [Alphaproteobacteria bacterium]
MTVRRSVVVGCGGYLPEKVLTNDELAQRLDTSDEWIRDRSGITQRYIAAEGEMTSDLGTAAARDALSAAGFTAADIGLIVVATSTPDETFPATATVVQAKLGADKAMAFDVQAVCSGFVYALATADNFIKSGQVDSALVIGAETFSRILDWQDRGTCVLFGDGAGALVLKAESGAGTTADRGVLSTHLHSDGRLHDLLYVDGGPSSTGEVGFLRMEGKEVFRHAVVKMAEVTVEALEANDLSASDIDWFVPHQANKRIIDGTAKKLGISGDKVVVTIESHANTSAASIPLALWVATQDQRIKRDDLVLIEALGGGMTWGSGLVRW